MVEEPGTRKERREGNLICVGVCFTGGGGKRRDWMGRKRGPHVGKVV